MQALTRAELYHRMTMAYIQWYRAKSDYGTRKGVGSEAVHYRGLWVKYRGML